MTDFSLPLRLK